MTAARFIGWSRRASIVLAATLLPGALAGQEPRPLELRSWVASRVGTSSSPLSFSGDLTSCTLVRCNQAASLFASTKLPFDVGLAIGARLTDTGAEQIGGRSALGLGSVYLDYDAGPLRMWSGATMGHARRDEGATPDPAPGVEAGLSVRWRSVGVALSAAGGRLLTSTAGNRIARASPVIRNYEDSLGFHSDTTYPPSGDSTGTSSDRWSSTEARVSWREERWWITARAGRLTSTRQAAALWAGVQAGRDLSHGVSLLVGAGTSSPAATYVGARNTSPHFSVGFGFNTAVLSSHETGVDSPADGGAASRAFAISDLGNGRYHVVLRFAKNVARSVEMACDCDGWTPVPMTRVGDVWAADVHARPGVHHVSIRVDGGGWISPPGLAAIDDDFAGRAGLLVIP
ncbi:MAG TPA: hypothetical protein VNC18_21815 [Gemmatimonadaceae bacterium]|nr:hypothetical protein [Gemmatimonadaceae bacterium]